MRVLRILAPLAPLSVAVLAGCASDPPPKPAAAASTAAREDAKASAKQETASVTKAQCATWADHFATKVREANARRIRECAAELAQQGTPKPEADAKDLEGANLEAARLHDMIVDQCSAQAGAQYVVADAQCFMEAPKMEDWQKCQFKSIFFADYKMVSANHQKLFDQRCRVLSGRAAQTP